MSESPGSPSAADLTLFMTELQVGDWPGLVSWYVEVLGLRPVLRDEAGGFALLAAGPGRLALKRATAPGSGGRVRLVFLVGDIEAEKDRLHARGVAVSEPAENPREAYREVRLTDPEGTPITLFCWDSPHT
jgi:predicted enzyme related to lactoylglutathione lyase